jgi:hypothetical protein
MFVPKGYLQLTTAVDQLAEARRPAGQTNDDGKNAARAELGAELHSGSISTRVFSPSSGRSYAIDRHNWVREIALTWLEQGECLLTEPDADADDPFFSPGYGERVKIFVRRDDLQRLIANQEVKQESVPPPDPIPPRPKPISEADKNRRFDEWRESRVDNIPSEKEDIDYMKKYGVSRDWVRKRRQQTGVKIRPSGKRRPP